MKLFLKMFLAYWVIVTVVNFFSDVIVRDQLRRPPFTRAAMRSALNLYAQEQMTAFERGGCAAVKPLQLPSGDGFYLADTNGKTLCRNLNAGGLETLAQKLRGSRTVLSRRFDTFQVVGTEVQSASGKTYLAYLVSNYSKSSNFASWLMPGWTTSTASGVVTIAFTILLAIPARRLRKAASDIAGGNLHARVKVRKWSMLGPDDEMRALMLDFNRMANRLENLVDSQRLLLRDVSHELRSPLARLGLALELARRTEDREALLHLARIEKESARLNNLIGQLLSLSAMETRLDEMNGSTLSLAELVQQVLPDVEYEATMRRCEIYANVEGECVVKGDPDLLHSALENVLRNAIRYSPEGGRITLDVASTSQDGMATIRVCDAGPGVPPDELQAILRPFYRVDKARGPKTGGFGVGLAIADRALRLYGGKINAANREHGGLMVEMSLPLEAEESLFAGHA